MVKYIDFLNPHMLNRQSSSVCGYDGDAQQKVYQQQRLAKSRKPQATGTPWERRAPYDYHGCLAHADITYVGSTGEVRRVIGVLEHMELCVKAKLTFPQFLFIPTSLRLLWLSFNKDRGELFLKSLSTSQYSCYCVLASPLSK